MEPYEPWAAQLAQLETGMESGSAMTQAFGQELERLRDNLSLTGREVSSLSNGFGSELRRAFDGVVFGGDKLSDSLKGLGQSMAATLYNSAMRPVQNALGASLLEGVGSLLGGLMPFAKGGAFTQGRVMPFAKGGVVSAPVSFPMRGGVTGLMGEAGPEAIMPLTRGADGRLGVAAQGGGGRAVTVVMNISTPDVAGFQRSQSQIAQQASRALSRGNRNR